MQKMSGYQVNFRLDTKLSLVLSDFSKTQRYNLKTLAQLFKIAIHFLPGHPQLKTLEFGYTYIVTFMRIRFLAYQGVAKNSSDIVP